MICIGMSVSCGCFAKRVVFGISDALFYYFALMKDPHFSHENERRFSYYINRDDSRIHFRC